MAAQGVAGRAYSHTEDEGSAAEWQGLLRTRSGREVPKYIGLKEAAKGGGVR